MRDPIHRDDSLAELARGLRAGGITACDLAERAIARWQDGNRDGFRTWDPAGARQAALTADRALRSGHDHGILHGIPWSAKDLYGTGLLPVYAGTPRALPARFQVPGPLVRRLQESGAVLMGKTHTVEFAFGGLGVNTHCGTPRNVSSPAAHRLPGGSSAGAAVSVREGSSLIALATDTAGSVRIPASWHGLAGLKTTAGRWPTAGIVPLSPTLDSAGIIARSVADLAFAFRGLDDNATATLEPPASHTITLGIIEAHFWDDTSPGVTSCVEQALATLAKHGFARRAVELPEVAAAHALFLNGGPVAAELQRFIAAELPSWMTTLDPVVAPRLATASAIDDAELAARRRRVQELARAAAARLASLEVDVLVTPTVALSPPPLAEVATTDSYRRANFLALRNTAPVNYLGLCALTLPVGLDAAGMPVGMQLIAPARQEERLLAIGCAIEDALEALVPPPSSSR